MSGKSKTYALKLMRKKKSARLGSRRIALLSGTTIDRDMLDEETRARLGRVNKDDLIVLLKPDAQPGPATP